MTTTSMATTQQLRRLMSEIERGGREVGMRPKGLEPLVRRFERLANRIVLAIVAAAFINGLAILMSVYPGWETWVGAGFAVGFLLAAALGRISPGRSSDRDSHQPLALTAEVCDQTKC